MTGSSTPIPIPARHHITHYYSRHCHHAHHYHCGRHHHSLSQSRSGVTSQWRREPPPNHRTSRYARDTPRNSLGARDVPCTDRLLHFHHHYCGSDTSQMPLHNVTSISVARGNKPPPNFALATHSHHTSQRTLLSVVMARDSAATTKLVESIIH